MICRLLARRERRKALTHLGAVALHESVKAALPGQLRGSVRVRTRADALPSASKESLAAAATQPQ